MLQSVDGILAFGLCCLKHLYIVLLSTSYMAVHEHMGFHALRRCRRMVLKAPIRTSFNWGGAEIGEL